MAEDPGNGQSFGMHRCRLSAEGLVDAWRTGRNDLEAHFDAVKTRFALNRLRLDRPYLGPDAIDHFDLPEPEAWAA